MEVLKEFIGLALNIAMLILAVGWLLFFYKESKKDRVLKISNDDLDRIADRVEHRMAMRDRIKK